MRVVHVVPALFGTKGVRGGAERYAYSLSLAMADAVPTTLVSFGDRRESRTVGQLHIELYPAQWTPLGERHNAVSLSLLRATRHASVIHCHQTATLTTELMVLWGRLKQKRVYVMPHGGGGRLIVSKFLPVLSLANGFVVQSQFSLHRLPSRYQQRTTVITGGVDTKQYQPNLGQDRLPHVLFVGRLLPHKGINYLIDALHYVRHSVTLTIAGTVLDEKFFRYLQQLAAGLPVQFVLGATDADVRQMYCRSAVTVLPSVYQTVFYQPTPLAELAGLTLLESMACGTPVICTAVGGMPEYVSDHRTGLVVPPNSSAAIAAAIDEVLSRPEWIVRAPTECVATCRHYDWHTMAQQCLELYERDAMSKPGRTVQRALA